MSDEPVIAVRDAPESSRYEVTVDGGLAGIVVYEMHPDEIVLVHTEVHHTLRGLGSRLARGALDDTRARGLRVVARCPFIAAYIRRHPEYADLLVG